MAIKINTVIENDFDGHLLDAKNVKGSYVVVSGTGDDTKENIYASTKVIGTLAYDVNLDTTYRWDGTNWVEVDGGTAGSCLKQVQVLPTITTENLGKIFQYIGNTTDVYTKGYIYEAKNLGTEATPDYQWVAVSGAGDISSIKYTNENATTKELGGIAKGTTFDNVPLDQLLTDLLYPYVAFNFSKITTADAAGEIEHGTPKEVKTVTPIFTLGSKPITSIVIKNNDGTEIYSGTTATSGTAITLANKITLDGETDYTISVTISDGKTTTTKSVMYDYEKYVYHAVTSTTTPPTSGTKGNDADITTGQNQYIWFLTPYTFTQIQQFANGQWNDVDTIDEGTVEFNLNSGVTCTYHAYRTKLLNAHTGAYQII